MINVYFLPMREDLRRLFPSLDLPDDFVIPVAAPGVWEDIADRVSIDHILGGLLLAGMNRPDHPSQPHWIEMLRLLGRTSSSFVTAYAELLLRDRDLEGVRQVLDFLQDHGLTDPDSDLVRARWHAETAKLAADREDWEVALEHRRLARELFSRLLETETPSPLLLKSAGLFHFQVEEFDKARTLWDRYLQLQPDDTSIQDLVRKLQKLEEEDTLFKSAYDNIQMNREEEGLAAVEKLLALRKNAWQVWFLKGWALRRLGRFAEALEAFEGALDLQADVVDALNEVGLCLYELGRYEEAERTWERALEKEPMNIKILSNLGILNLKMGDEANAKYYFHAVLDIVPDDQIATAILQELESGQT